MSRTEHCIVRSTRLVGALSSGALLLLAAAAPRAGNVVAGAKLYAEHCVSCHEHDGGGVAGVPDLRRGRALLRSDPELFAVVRQGRGVMPGFDGILRGEEMRDVIGHLRSLR